MNPRSARPKWVRRLLRWLSPLVLIGIVVAIYRWSEPARIPHNKLSGTSSVGVGIHLENAPFTAFAGKRKAWSLWAKGIDLEHPVYSGSASFQSASITDIRDGVLYSVSNSDIDTVQPITPTSPHAHRLSQISSSTPVTPDRPASVKFHAGFGHYFIGAIEPLPGDLNTSYSARWQLQLGGNVAVTTRDGNSLHAESLVLMELTNLKTRLVEQRVECDSGATVTRRGVTITANKLRYSLNDHTVELLDGVRCTFRAGSVQSQRVFWSLNSDLVQIPDPSTGVLNGNDFSAQSITLDLKNGLEAANHGTIYFRNDKDGDSLLEKRHR